MFSSLAIRLLYNEQVYHLKVGQEAAFNIKVSDYITIQVDTPKNAKYSNYRDQYISVRKIIENTYYSSVIQKGFIKDNSLYNAEDYQINLEVKLVISKKDLSDIARSKIMEIQQELEQIKDNYDDLYEEMLRILKIEECEGHGYRSTIKDDGPKLRCCNYCIIY